MSRFLPLCLALATALTFTHARADDRADAQAFVDKAKGSLEAFIADPEMIWFRDNVGEAKAVVIIATMVKGGFIFGGSGGTGVFL